MHQVERALDVFDLVGEDFDLKPFAVELLVLQSGDDLVDLSRHLEHIGARLAGKQHHHGWTVLHEGDADRLAKRQLHGGHVSEEDGGAVAACSEHDFFERGRRFWRDSGPHQVASLPEGDVAARQIAELASHPASHVLHRKPARSESLRVKQHVDLGVLTADEEDARHAGDTIDLRENLVFDPGAIRRDAALVRIPNRNHGQRWPGAVGCFDDGFPDRIGIARNLAELVGHANERFFDDRVDLELERDAPAVHAGARLHAGEPLHVLEHLFLWLEDLGLNLYRRGARPDRAHADRGSRNVRGELNRQVHDRERAEQDHEHDADDDRNRSLNGDPGKPGGLLFVRRRVVGHRAISLPAR